jgi:hypothetical protein
MEGMHAIKTARRWRHAITIARRWREYFSNLCSGRSFFKAHLQDGLWKKEKFLKSLKAHL